MPESSQYDVIVVGGGSAGIVAGVTAAGLGAKTLLIERSRLGGECSWTGCVPSKALLHAASVAQQLRTASDYGLPSVPVSREQAAGALAYVRDSVQRVHVADDSGGLLAQVGAEVAIGRATFTAPDTLNFEGGALTAKHFILCTGSRPVVPDVEGLREAGFVTNQTIFDLQTIPETLVVIGGGPVGVEMAQAFQRLGSQVTLVTQGARLLTRDDAELTEQLTGYLRAEGLTVHVHTKVARVRVEDGRKILTLQTQGGDETATFELTCDEILAATGRAPNVEDLGLLTARVRLEKEGVWVDARLHTTGPNVWACGDVIGRMLFSHMAEFEAKIVVQNALFPLAQRPKFRVVPWATFTDPELAHVGLTEAEAQAQNIHYDVFRHPFDRDDRALVEGTGRGQVKILSHGLSGKIIGAQILGPRAGELIHEFILAMEHGLTTRDLADLIHVYPTLNISIQRAAQRWYEKLAARPLVKSALDTYMRITR